MIVPEGPLIVAVEVILITPVMVRQANLYSLLSSVLLMYLTLGHHTMEPYVKMGLIAMV
jgi:hypothetical protein